MFKTVGNTPAPAQPIRTEANAPASFGEAFKQSWRDMFATNKPLLAMRVLAWATIAGGVIDLAVSAYAHSLGKLGQGAQPATPSRLNQAAVAPAAGTPRATLSAPLPATTPPRAPGNTPPPATVAPTPTAQTDSPTPVAPAAEAPATPAVPAPASTPVLLATPPGGAAPAPEPAPVVPADTTIATAAGSIPATLPTGPTPAPTIVGLQAPAATTGPAPLPPAGAPLPAEAPAGLPAANVAPDNAPAPISTDHAVAAPKRTTAEGFAGSEALSRMGASELEDHQQAVARGEPTRGRSPIPVTAEDRTSVADYAPRDQAQYFSLRQANPTMSHDEALAIVFPPAANAAPAPLITAQAARDLARNYHPNAQSTADELTRLQTSLRNSQLIPRERDELIHTTRERWTGATAEARAAANQQRRDAFDGSLAAQGLRPFEAGGGGHCMFHSMAHQLNGVRPQGHIPQQTVRENLLLQLANLTPTQQAWVTDRTNPAEIAAELTRLRAVLDRGITSPGGGGDGIWGDKGHARLLALQTGRPVVLASYLEGVQVYHPAGLGRTDGFASPTDAGLAQLVNGNPPAITLYHTGRDHWQSVADVNQRPERSSDLPDALADFPEASKTLYRQLIADGQPKQFALDQVLSQPADFTPTTRTTTAAARNDVPQALADFPEASKAFYRQLIADGRSESYALNRVIDGR